MVLYIDIVRWKAQTVISPMRHTVKENAQQLPKTLFPQKSYCVPTVKTIQPCRTMKGKKATGINRDLQLAHIGRSSSRLDTGCQFHFLHHQDLQTRLAQYVIEGTRIQLRETPYGDVYPVVFMVALMTNGCRRKNLQLYFNSFFFSLFTNTAQCRDSAALQHYHKLSSLNQLNLAASNQHGRIQISIKLHATK